MFGTTKFPNKIFGNIFLSYMELVKNQRIRELVAELKKRHIIRNQSHFAEIVGSDRATISEIINEHIAVPNKLFGNILDKFPSVNPDWLNDGEGPMFRVTGETTQGDTFNIAGDYTNLGNQTVTIVSPEVMVYLREEQRQSAVHLSQINRLITIIEHITGTPIEKNSEK